MPDLTPEQRARQQIDAQLVACGWAVQDYRQFNPSAGRGIALREAPLKSGTCDYLLLVDRKAVGVAEAKKEGNLKAEVTFRRTATVEETHYNMYKGAFESVTAGKDLAAASVYICPVCGHTVVGGLPDKCPVCDTRKDRFFEVK